MTNFINKVFNRFEFYLHKKRLNIFATIYINFRTLPFKLACKLPIYVYGKITFYSLSGNIQIDASSIKKGLIKIGRQNDNYVNNTISSIHIGQNSTIIFNGYCSIAQGFNVKLSEYSRLVIGDKVQIGNNVRIFGQGYIEIQDFSCISFGSILIDSNFHYQIDLVNNRIRRREGKIIIGKRCWIGNNCILTKGCHIGDDSSVAAGSIASYNYSKVSKAIISGIPAEVQYDQYIMVHSFERENEINEFFIMNPDKKSFKYEGVWSDPIEDLKAFFE